MPVQKVERTAPLSRFEAGYVYQWLEAEKGKKIQGGWTSVYRRTPEEVAKEYNVSKEDVIKAARRP